MLYLKVDLSMTTMKKIVAFILFLTFASGVGAKSATVGYGLNRADWSYIPGGVVSGTALIRPDFPELLVFPFLWQQVEYVLGGGSSHYMFLVLAAKDLMQ